MWRRDVVNWGFGGWDLLSACPEGVAACGHASLVTWKLQEAQRSVICGYGLELDVGMPLCGIVAALVCLAVDLIDLLTPLGADGANFGIVDAELGGVVEHGVDVQGGT